MVSGITPCARECKWIVYFGETPKDAAMAHPAARAIFLPATHARLFLSARRVVDTRTGKHTARTACAREAVKIFVASERG
jgi:hypothetical protein